MHGRLDTEKLKSAGTAQESTKALLELVLGLNKEKDEEDEAAPHARERREQRQRREERQRVAELAELKEYREVLREELASLWATKTARRPPAAATAAADLEAAVGGELLEEVQGELERARREALRLRRQNDALVGELRDLDALILQAEGEGIDVFPAGAAPAAGRKQHQHQQRGAPSRRHLEPTLEEVRQGEDGGVKATSARGGISSDSDDSRIHTHAYIYTHAHAHTIR